MKRAIEMILPYPPSTGNTMARHTKTGGHYTNPKYEAWRCEIRKLVGMQHGYDDPLPGPLTIDIFLVPPDDKQRDSSNVLKVLEDALVFANLLADDSNRVIRKTTMEWADKTPDHPDGLINVLIKEL